MVLTTGLLSTAARTNDTSRQSSYVNNGGPTPLIGGGAAPTYDAAVLTFRLTSLVNGNMRFARGAWGGAPTCRMQGGAACPSAPHGW